MAKRDTHNTNRDEPKPSHHGSAETGQPAADVNAGAPTPADAEPEPAKQKAPFKVEPNHSGFAPGVTPENLKDVIFELEDEEFLEKLKRLAQYNQLNDDLMVAEYFAKERRIRERSS